MQRWKWFYPGMRVKRHILLVFLGALALAVGLGNLWNLWQGRILPAIPLESLDLTMAGTLATIILGVFLLLWGLRNLIHSIAASLRPEKEENLVASLYQQRHMHKGPRIVVIGGGTGLSTMLRGLKQYTDHLTAIVTVADDGGSSGKIREELGILPPGDIRNTLVAMADTEPLLEKLFQYRFSWGEGLQGHSFGNLFIAAMTDITGDFEEGIRAMSKVLAVRGRVLPATLESTALRAHFRDGTEVLGESRIPEVGQPIAKISLEPEHAAALPEALDAIAQADVVVLGPGSLYTSVIPNLLVDGVPEALAASSALRVYVCNVMTQPGETDAMTASEHVQALLEHSGGHSIVDWCLVNHGRISREQAEAYAHQGAYPIAVDRQALTSMGLKIKEAELLDQRHLVRHDPAALATAIMELAASQRNLWRDRTSFGSRHHT